MPCTGSRTPSIFALLVEDAVRSSTDAGHDALMTMYRLRYAQQIDLVKAEALPEYWRRAT